MRKLLLLALTSVAFFPATLRADDCVDCCEAPPAYFTIEGLRYWIKDGPVPAPLLTAGPPLGLPGIVTSPLLVYGGSDLGGSNIDYGEFQGLRGLLGYRLPGCKGLALEVGGFGLDRESTRFSARSNANGSPFLAFPFLDTSTGAPNSLILSSPAPDAVLFASTPDVGASPAVGGASFFSRSRLWGAESNLVLELPRCDCQKIEGLVGLRYLDLREQLLITADSTFTFTPFDPVFVPPPVGASFLTLDDFHTSNRFYGGQVGARARWCWDHLTVGATGKIAFGTMHQRFNANGGTTSALSAPVAGVPVGVFPGGFYTQPSNIGSTWRDRFAFVPEGTIEVGYQPWEWVRLTVGYNFLYVSNVARPGLQIDPAINSSRTVNFPRVTPPAPTGPVAPNIRREEDDFFAHGFSFGLSIGY